MMIRGERKTRDTTNQHPHMTLEHAQFKPYRR